MNGTDIMLEFVPASPMAAALGIELTEVSDGRAILRLPFSETATTTADVVHGGAIATLADMATMAAAWGGAPLPDPLRGVTVSLTVDYLDAARAEALTATGRLLRRGRSLCSCEVDVTGEDGRLVAKALGTYKLG